MIRPLRRRFRGFSKSSLSTTPTTNESPHINRDEPACSGAADAVLCLTDTGEAMAVMNGAWFQAPFDSLGRPRHIHRKTRSRSKDMPRRPLKDSRGLTIAVCNIDVQALFRQYPDVRIHEVHCKADENLTSEVPAPSNHELLPGSLAAAVIRHECAFGVAFDGDAGRLLVIDETVEMVPPDLIGAALAVQLLSDRQGAVVLYDLRSSRAVAEAIEQGGGRAIRARPGPSSLAAALCEQQALFAFDIAGRYLYDDQQAGDNEQRTLIELVRLVAAGGRPLSSLIRPLQRYALNNEINFRVTNRREVLAMLQEKYHNGRIDHFDGLTVNYPGWWFNARKARTEPLIRLNVGAVNRNLLEQKLDALEKQLDPFFILFEII